MTSWRTEFWVDEAKTVGLVVVIVGCLVAFVPVSWAVQGIRRVWR